MEESVRKSGKPGHRQESVWESGEPGDMQESVCESGESVKGLSLRALRARAGGDHVPTQLWTSFGTLWDQFGTKVGPNLDKSEPNVGPIWDRSGTNVGTCLGQLWRAKMEF